MRLQHVGLADIHLDRIGTSVHQRTDHRRHVFESVKKGVLVENSVIDGDVETAAISTQESIQANFVSIIHKRKAG